MDIAEERIHALLCSPDGSIPKPTPGEEQFTFWKCSFDLRDPEQRVLLTRFMYNLLGAVDAVGMGYPETLWR